ncbi:myb-related protein 1 [Rhynchospora pubera]|uniref:Myb-related protein 1 n=1 Tax=Rhynchospora pubera TaxID=906938 RepID=A0AAV8DBU9_9POAL|nr:myb-related protein 1 [Rhynchospora pubera]
MMYQGHDNIISPRSVYSSEKESGLILSTDAKPRLKWTPELHERFTDAVAQLGGPDKATPKTIMRLMGIPGLTLYHLKSHLQKYRLSKNLQAQAHATNVKNVASSHVPMESRPPEGLVPINHLVSSAQPNKTIQISEALQMQIEVQRRLHEQLEVQRHLQLRIEAQGKYLQTVLEKAQETLTKQNPGQTGIESTKLHLSELVSKVSNEYLHNSFQAYQELNSQNTVQQASADSCLTACEGSQKDNQRLNQIKNEWDSNLLSIGLRTEIEASGKEMDGRDLFLDRQCRSRTQHLNQQERRIECVSTQLDLNTKEVIDGSKSCKKFDLNGFSWN